MKPILVLFLLIISGCVKSRCKLPTIFESELKLSNQVHLGYINVELSTDEKYIGSETFLKQGDTAFTYTLRWDMTHYLEGEPRGKRLYVKTRLFDWRDGSYYYLVTDTVYKN